MKIKNLLLIAFLFSCKSHQTNLYEFDPRAVRDNKITLSDIADDITYIPIDNSHPLSLIYSPRFFTKNSIYLSAYNSGIMALNREGKLKNKIGLIGRGPVEYNFYTKFCIDDKNETVYVLDGEEIKVYSKSGNFLRDISLKAFGDWIASIEFFNSKLLISYNLQSIGNKYEWLILDTLGNLLKNKKRAIPPFTSNWPTSGGIYKFEDNIYIWNTFNDTVFSILPDLSFKPAFLFISGEHRVPRSKITDISKFKLYFNPDKVFETRRFIVIHYSYKKLFIALIDKETKRSYLTILESGPAAIGNNYIGGILNDLDGGISFQPESYYIENNREYLLGVINPLQLKLYITKNEFKDSNPRYPERKKELEKLAYSLTETDNPILMIVRLKK